jgi:hypothetical protein
LVGFQLRPVSPQKAWATPTEAGRKLGLQQAFGVEPQSLAKGENLRGRVKKVAGGSCKLFLRLLTQMDVASLPQNREKLRH